MSATRKRAAVAAAALALSAVAFGIQAQQKEASTLDRTVLPPPAPPFRGKIEVAYKDSKGEFPEPVRAPQRAPNVLLIMGDDIGYGNMSAFGGPANTPNFDWLAKQGLSFTNFHATAVCSASRAALLTGRNAHAVGMGGVPETAVGFPGYNAVIPRSAATVFEILRQNGYGTAWIGKTHLTPTHETSSAGPFDRWPSGMGAEYAFDDAKAKDRRTTQYFELFGGRAIYHEGWWAGTRHGVDGVSKHGGTPYDKDVWELYDMRSDFGHANDLAARNPDKLKELQALFDKEARKYNVYPMADDIKALLTAERPELVSGNKASYGPGTVRLPEDGVMNVKNRSFSLVAEVDNRDGKAEGMLVTLGGESGGYALLVQQGKPTFHYNFLGLERCTITSSEPLPKGKSTVRFDFAYDGGGMGKGGKGTLSINGKKVAEGRIKRTVPVVFSTDDTFDVGEDWGTPVSPTYRLPSRFTGALKKVTVEVK